MKQRYITPATMLDTTVSLHSYMQHVSSQGNVNLQNIKDAESGDAGEEAVTKSRSEWSSNSGLWTVLLILSLSLFGGRELKAQIIEDEPEVETYSPAAPPSDFDIHGMVLHMADGTTVHYEADHIDHITYLIGVGMKVYTTDAPDVSVDYLFSEMLSVDYYITGSTSGGGDEGDNVNANWNETAYNIPQSGISATTESATYDMAWRLEYPHISTDEGSMVVVHATSTYKISLSVEVDLTQRANRWSCFTMHDGTPNNNVGRSTGSFHKDNCIPADYQVDTDEYTTGRYTTSATNDDGSTTVLFSRGHVCASEDRQSSAEQNRHTFYTTNVHPQYQQHNGGLWGRMESRVQAWGEDSDFRDTLYVCKGATIADVTLDGLTTSGLIPYSEVQTKYGVSLTGSLPIPRYWYMALLCLKDGEYHAVAFWTEQVNSKCASTTLRSCMISIDELEHRTGIDFFCNLPDSIERTVESSFDNTFWGVNN